MSPARISIGTLLSLAFAVGIFVPRAEAAVRQQLTLADDHFIFTLTSDASWEREEEVWTYRGIPIVPMDSWRVVPGERATLPEGVERGTLRVWDTDAVARAIRRSIAPSVERSSGSVVISRAEDGKITFDGTGLSGRHLDIEATARLVVAALERGIDRVVLPVEEIPPSVRVDDPELVSMGIKELVSIGESDFTGSSASRQRNIGVGLKRFNGHLIPAGETFSFVKVLGPVNAATGYVEELVIKGDKVLPDFGGGLCQVSTTAYRGAWEYGLPIVRRKNHSFAVRYYGPQGTDATVYPPDIDLQFTNDTPGALLMQTYREGTRAYFIYYGTKDARETEVVGPYTWDHRDPPAPKVEYTTEIPAGTTRKVGEAVPGLTAAWFRRMERDGVVKIERVVSDYMARPRFHQIGVAGGDARVGTVKTEAEIEVEPAPPPDWIGITPPSV